MTIGVSSNDVGEGTVSPTTVDVTSTGRAVGGLAGQNLGTILAVYLDVDGNGSAAALSDGMLIVRYLGGFTGDDLISGRLGQGATRNAAKVKEYLDTLTGAVGN